MEQRELTLLEICQIGILSLDLVIMFCGGGGVRDVEIEIEIERLFLITIYFVPICHKNKINLYDSM